MSTLRRRAALKRLVNPNQSGSLNQSRRNIDLLIYLHYKLFLQNLALRADSKPKISEIKAAKRKAALIKVLQEFQDPKDNVNVASSDCAKNLTQSEDNASKPEQKLEKSIRRKKETRKLMKLMFK
ncbi:hypothetical protein RclHR1_01870008 [Rhizophagus clarus]|uniref:Uncharacterized protein n=1 Tax=Rhizophagus clarus TaxID=94130 RepID=A0A2Z6QMA9_9GLOM|nr:hypothetical protein RclHR1_01870008 [Rhizophagus clarus]GES83808.1 hypothetical protein GLOIN_2v1637354 [Rhizophagus clarus]